jgi:hypothetical protein
MRVRAGGFVAALGLFLAMAPGVASACHACKQTPCVVAAPAYTCVTELVPQTCYKTITKTAYQEVVETILTRVPHTTYVERQRIVCKPVWETTTVQRTVSFCKPVSETHNVTQTYTVCKPVSTTRQVTEYCMQPTTSYVSVPVVSKHCGLCGKVATTCGCAVVAQTCYTPVPVVKNVVVTTLVPETVSRVIPVTTTHYVTETKVENVPVKTCRMVQEVVTDKLPVTTYECVPKQITRKIPYPVCETVAYTKYIPVKHMVPCAPVAYAAPAPAPTPQAAPMTMPAASPQAPSKQG